MAKRHELQLRELLYLLKHKTGSGQDFLKHKLTKALDTQLRGLVNGRLKDDFDELHRFLDARELSIAQDIFQWRKVFFPQVMASLKGIEEEDRKDRELIERAELALQQGTLESTKTQALLAGMHAANRRDSVAKTRLLQNTVNLDHHRVFGLASVKRAVDRLYIAKGDAAGAAEAQSFSMPVAATAADIKASRLHWVSVYGAAYRRLLDAWVRKFSDRAEIGTDIELDGLLREQVDGLATDHTLLEELSTKLFQKYDSRVSEAHKRKLKAEVSDAIAAVFQRSQAALADVVQQLSARMDYEGHGTVQRAAAAGVWATYWEKALQGAVELMVLDRQPKPIALTAPADQPQADDTAGGAGDDAAGGDYGEDDDGVAVPVWIEG